MTKGLLDGTTFYFTCPAVTGLPVPIFTSENAPKINSGLFVVNKL